MFAVIIKLSWVLEESPIINWTDDAAEIASYEIPLEKDSILPLRIFKVPPPLAEIALPFVEFIVPTLLVLSVIVK